MTNRDLSFDVLRGIAIIFVVFIHVNSLGYIDGSSPFNIKMSIFLRQIANFAVPLFLFISGYFMGVKSFNGIEEYFVFYKKQLPRVLLPFVVWSCFYSGIMFFQGVPIGKILYKFITFQAAAPFYYILLICQYYIILPVLRTLANSNKGVILSFLISIGSCLIIEYLRYGLKIYLPLYVYAGSFTTWLIFPVLGICVRNKDLTFGKNVFPIFAILMIVISFIHSLMLIKIYDDLDNAVSAVKISSFMYSVAIIIVLFFFRMNLKKNNVFVILGEMSFGIYFSHMFFVMISKSILYNFFENSVISNVFVQILLTILITLFSVIIGTILKRINNNFSSKYFGY